MPVYNPPKLKNKIDEKTGHFLCTTCGREVGIGVIIKGYVYCRKCGKGKK